MKLKLTVAAVLTAVGITACGPGAVGNGPVLGKQFTPAHNEQIQVPVYRTQCIEEEEPGSNGTETEENICTQVFSYYQNQIQYYGPEWSIKVKGAKRTGWEDVSEAEYNALHVGSIYEKGE